MNIKKCSKCGWEFPETFESRRCKFCGTPFKMGYCNRCGEWTENLHKTVCTACNTLYYNEWLDRKRQDNEDAFESWCALIKKQPTRTLTEEDWLQACKYFGGCAFCGSDSIDAREMFIQFKDGGRYTAWNIVPACEACATRRKDTKNPFKKMDEKINRQKYCPAKRYSLTKENLLRIVDYLRSKMEVNDNE